MALTKFSVLNLSFTASVAAVVVALTGCQTVDPVPGDHIGTVLMHGRGGTTRHVFPLGSALKSAGILVEMPLMPWSKGRIYDKGYEASMVEIDTYVVHLRSAGAKRIVVAGFSIGANAALGYAARREDLSGVILLAYGHVPGIPGFSRKLSDSVEKARSMIDVGEGDQTAVFTDFGGGNDTATSTANDLLSWFDPSGPATIAKNAPKVKPNTPVLCIDGSSDRWKRCGQIMWQVPRDPMNRQISVSADHMSTPSVAIQPIVDWLRELK